MCLCTHLDCVRHRLKANRDKSTRGARQTLTFPSVDTLRNFPSNCFINRAAKPAPAIAPNRIRCSSPTVVTYPWWWEQVRATGPPPGTDWLTDTFGHLHELLARLLIEPLNQTELQQRRWRYLSMAVWATGSARWKN